ncbi:MAG TPA: DUF3368 domain-containing protein [Rhodocyclaceae bacterium]|nr:DUF3368 domain-containing protein [Rhodocyclaceae bacterium]
MVDVPVIFSDTTPLIALSSIGRLDVLPMLFHRVCVVDAVVDECAAGGRIAVPDLTRLPWIDVVHATEPCLPGLLLSLDRGERDTLDMARKMNAERVIIDERIGRDMAELLGIPVVGTLGILLKAKSLGAISSFSQAVADMMAHGIYYHSGLVDELSRRAGEK